MSNQNFVSYGDAETLMSGIASAISGGGGIVTKKVIANYTDNTVPFYSLAGDLYTKLSNLSDDLLAKCVLKFTRTTGVIEYYKIARSYKSNSGRFEFARCSDYNHNYYCEITSYTSFQWYPGTSTNYGGTNTLESQNIASIELYYDTFESAVNVSVTRKTVAEYTTTSQTFNQIGADLYPKLSALTDAQRLKSYVVIEADGTGTDFPFKSIKMPYSSQLNVNPYIFDSGSTYNGNYHFYVHQNGAECGLQITNSTQLGGSSTLATRGVTKIGVYYDEAEDITSAVQTELDSLDARVDALEQSGGGKQVYTIQAQSGDTYRSVYKRIADIIFSLQNIEEHNIILLEAYGYNVVGYYYLYPVQSEYDNNVKRIYFDTDDKVPHLHIGVSTILNNNVRYVDNSSTDSSSSTPANYIAWKLIVI